RGLTHTLQCTPQSPKERCARFILSRLENLHGPGAQYVVATPGGGRPPAIKKHGTRLAVEPGKPVGRVGVVGEGDQRAGWRHGQLLGERRLCNAEARRQKLSRATPRTIL